MNLSAHQRSPPNIYARNTSRRPQRRSERLICTYDRPPKWGHCRIWRKEPQWQD